MSYVSTITLREEGLNGPIVVDTGFTPEFDGGYAKLPHNYETTAWLMNLLEENMENVPTVANPEDKENIYEAVLKFEQANAEADVYFSLVVTPRLDAGEANVPVVYKVASALASTYLNMIGVINDDGEIENDEALGVTVNLEVSKPRLN